MTLKGTRTLRNMFLIGGAMSTASFFFGMFTFRNSYTSNLNYELKEFKGKIETISDIEDFERSKNCNFLFYNKSSGTNQSVKGARDYSNGDSAKIKNVVEKAESEKSNCTSNRYVFISL